MNFTRIWCLACVLFLKPLTVFSTISSQSAKYIWKPSVSLDDPQNWAGNDVPCADDVVNFDKGKVMAVFIPGGFKASEILLPDDGVLFTERYAIIGEKSDWQCAARKHPVETSFTPANLLPNVFDYRNWVIEGNGVSHRPMLHSERVPSKMDEVVFPSNTASRVEIDAPLLVGSLNMSNTYIVNPNFILTIEGQLLFSLGPKLKDQVIIDDIEYQLPLTDVIQIFPGPIASKQGIKNSNCEKDQQEALCFFVQCAPTEKHCTNPVKPVGHCCPVCGIIMRFVDANFDLYATSKTIPESMILPTGGVSISRIDSRAFVPQYEIAVFTDEPATFDEDAYYRAAKMMYKQCKDIAANIQYNSMLGDEEQHLGGFYENYSLETNKIRLLPILKWVAFISLIFGIIFMYVRNLYKTSARFRMRVASLRRTTVPQQIVTWRNNTDNENVVIVAENESIFEENTEAISLLTIPKLEQHVYQQEFKNPIFNVEDDIFASSSAIKTEEYKY